MKFSIRFVALALATAVLTAVPTTASAALVTFNLNGTLGNTFPYAGLPPADYPFPGLLGGSFDGTITLDDAAAPSVASNFTYVASQINLRDTANVIVHTISPNVGEIRIFNGSFGLYIRYDLRRCRDAQAG